MKKKLQIKVAAIIACLTLVLLLVNAIFSVRTAKNNFNDLQDTKYQNAANYYAEMIDNWFTKNIAVLETAGTSVIANKGPVSNLRGTFAEVLAQNDTVSELYYCSDRNELVFGAYEAPDDFDGTTRSWFKGAKATSGVYITEPYVDQISGSLCISMAKNLGDGVIGIDLNLSKLIDAIPALSDGEYLFVTTAEGAIVTHPNPDFALSGDKANYIKEVLDGAYANALETDAEYTDYNGVTSYITGANVSCNNWTTCLVTPKDTYNVATNSLISTLVILALILSIVAVVVSSFVGYSISKPIIKLAGGVREIIKGMEEKNCDLSVRLDKDTSDEIGGLTEDINALLAQFETIIGQVRGTAETVGSESEGLVDSSERLAKAVEGITEAVGEIAQGATQQATDIQVATENVDEIGMQLSAVEEIANALLKEAEKMQEASKASESKMAELEASSKSVENGIMDISQQIGNTNRVVDVINDKVSAITDIASQTNLLALNASIEAARAGEAGKGFAVVAEEIGKLAVNSSESANDIKNEMNFLLESAQSTVNRSDEIHELTDKQKQVVNDTSEAIGTLLESIAETLANIQNIHGKLQACVNARSAVAEVMESLSAISEENAASAEETNATAEEVNATITNLAQAARDLNGVTVELDDALDTFH